MRIGLAFDLKDSIAGACPNTDDALEEYDSAETVELVVSSLKALGHQVILLGGGREFLAKIQESGRCDLVFNIAEGRGNHKAREAQVPAILEMLDIPYTGSGPQCLAICLDKPLTKTILKTAGIRTPAWAIIESMETLNGLRWDELNFPVVVKPAFEGSSKGVHYDSLAENEAAARSTIKKLLESYNQAVLLEEYIDGVEVTVGIIGNSPPRIAGIMGIIPRQSQLRFMYSIEVKRDYINQVIYQCPANLPQDVLQAIGKTAIQIFTTLGCRDLARLDFKISPDGIPYFLEINPLPGLGNHSDLVIMSQAMGVGHVQLIGSILAAALSRYPQCAGT